MNVVTLSGRLTKDPEVRYTQDQRPVAGISIAVNRSYKTNNGPDVDFFDCTAFGKSAEVLEKYFHKGQRIMLTGNLQNDIYTNREGRKVTATKVIIDRLEFVDTKAEAERLAEKPADPQAGPSNAWMDIPDDVEDEGLPFN